MAYKDIPGAPRRAVILPLVFFPFLMGVLMMAEGGRSREWLTVLEGVGLTTFAVLYYYGYFQRLWAVSRKQLKTYTHPSTFVTPAFVRYQLTLVGQPMKFYIQDSAVFMKGSAVGLDGNPGAKPLGGR